MGPHWRPRHTLEDNSRIGLRETGYEGVDWIRLTQDRVQWWALMNMVMNLNVA
jgi:hypothetical protein